MASIKKKSGKKKSSAPDIKELIIKKISVALKEFQELWGEKKFNRKVKKAGKVLASGTKKNYTPA